MVSATKGSALSAMPAPGISAAERGVEAARFALKAARGAALPTLSASASYGTYYSDASPDVFKEQLDGNQNPSVSLSLVLPLFNGGKSAEAISNAKSDLEAARIKLEQARQQAALYREQLDGQCATLHSQTLALKANCALLEERLQTASKEYGLGAISTSEWIDAAEALLQGECDYAQSLCKYLFQIKIMEYYTDECR